MPYDVLVGETHAIALGLGLAPGSADALPQEGAPTGVAAPAAAAAAAAAAVVVARSIRRLRPQESLAPHLVDHPLRIAISASVQEKMLGRLRDGYRSRLDKSARFVLLEGCLLCTYQVLRARNTVTGSI